MAEENRSGSDILMPVPQGYELGTGKRIGNRWEFAIEFEIHKADGKIPRWWDDWYGSLWLWVDGRAVGNTDAFLVVKFAFETLCAVGAADRAAATAALSKQPSAAEKLDIVMGCAQADSWLGLSPEDACRTVAEEMGVPSVDIATMEEMRAKSRQMLTLDMLPAGTGWAFQGWQAVLLDEGEQERMIYRYRPEQDMEPDHDAASEGESPESDAGPGVVTEAVWPSGTVLRVAEAARKEFEAMAMRMFREGGGVVAGAGGR